MHPGATVSEHQTYCTVVAVRVALTGVTAVLLNHNGVKQEGVRDVLRYTKGLVVTCHFVPDETNVLVYIIVEERPRVAIVTSRQTFWPWILWADKVCLIGNSVIFAIKVKRRYHSTVFCTARNIPWHG